MSTVDLPDFQVHGLLCLPSEVQMLGWESLYRVAVSHERPSQGLREPLPDSGFVPEAFLKQPTASLGQWSLGARDHTTQSVSLAPAFELRIAAHRFGTCTIRLTTELLQRSSSGDIVGRLELYDSQFERDCH